MSKEKKICIDCKKNKVDSDSSSLICDDCFDEGLDRKLNEDIARYTNMHHGWIY